MTVLTHAWEFSLLSMAHYDDNAHGADTVREHQGAPAEVVRDAYAYCEALTADHSRSFYLSSRMLPLEKRRAVRALYAFCRVTDDVVDKPVRDARQDLDAWRERALSFNPPADDPVAVAWADARLRFAIPQHYAEQLINGVARDLSQSRYETFEDLAAYSYGVASTVGLMSMHIIGFNGTVAIPYAVKLGVALQVTNILRDIAEDWRNGRVYLPQQELHDFGLCEADIAAGVVTTRWRRFMKFQIARNRLLYEEAWPGIGLLQPEGRLAIGAAAELYRAILEDIERRDYDVFSGRAYIGSWDKLRRIPSVWWRTRAMTQIAPPAIPSDSGA